MKQLFNLLFLSALLCQNAYSQAYLKIGGGYGFSASKDNFSSPVVILERTSPSNTTIISKENIYGTIGSGANFRLAGGYNFSQNFGLELDLNYLMGAKKYVTGTEISNNNNTAPYKESSFAYTRQFRVTPSLFVRSDKGFVRPYAGFGVILPLAGFTYLELDSENPVTAKNTYIVRKISGHFTAGFESYMGASLNWPNENFNLFAELRYSGLRIKSKYSEIIQFDVTDLQSGEVTDNMDGLSTFQREINFVDKLTTASNAFEGPGGINAAAYDIDKPMDKLTSTNNFNAFGLNIGVRINLVKKKTE